MITKSKNKKVLKNENNIILNKISLQFFMNN